MIPRNEVMHIRLGSTGDPFGPFALSEALVVLTFLDSPNDNIFEGYAFP